MNKRTQKKRLRKPADRCVFLVIDTDRSVRSTHRDNQSAMAKARQLSTHRRYGVVTVRGKCGKRGKSYPVLSCAQGSCKNPPFRGVTKRRRK